MFSFLITSRKKRREVNQATKTQTITMLVTSNKDWYTFTHAPSCTYHYIVLCVVANGISSMSCDLDIFWLYSQLVYILMTWSLCWYNCLSYVRNLPIFYRWSCFENKKKNFFPHLEKDFVGIFSKNIYRTSIVHLGNQEFAAFITCTKSNHGSYESVAFCFSYFPSICR